MPSPWQNTKIRSPEASEMVSVRCPIKIKHRAQEIAEGGNSTLAAAVRWGLEKFIEEHDSGGAEGPDHSGGKPALFD